MSPPSRWCYAGGMDLSEWRNPSPGNLDDLLPAVSENDPEAVIHAAAKSAPDWAARPLEDRLALLALCRAAIDSSREDLAGLVSRETGKPLREARLELGAVIAKFDFTFEDARREIADRVVADGPHPAIVRHVPRGVASVIAPFNFPIHLGHGAALAYLAAGNTVVFKPSPLAANVGAAYAGIMASVLPEGVFGLVQGGARAGRAVAADPRVRAVCFTGSIPAGRALATDLAADYSKSLALELGGKNSAVVWRDADVPGAAAAVADGMCLTAGQRCNATSRVLVHEDVADQFLAALTEGLRAFQPGDPLDAGTLLGPLISAAAVERYREMADLRCGEWVVSPGLVPTLPSGQRGHYVRPAVFLTRETGALDASPLATQEAFVPLLVVEKLHSECDLPVRHNAWDFGLTASVFTQDTALFERCTQSFRVGNLYRNLPTTFSPSTLPFGGWGRSGNGRPGGRGFVRFAVDEQAVQWKD